MTLNSSVTTRNKMNGNHAFYNSECVCEYIINNSNSNSCFTRLRVPLPIKKTLYINYLVTKSSNSITAKPKFLIKQQYQYQNGSPVTIS